jgi:hypothetical protein
MKIHGWCQTCHKIKRVDVKVPRPRGINVGTCDACQDKK